MLVQQVADRLADLRLFFLDLRDKGRVGKGCEHLAQAGNRDAATPERKAPPLVGRPAVAGIQRFELRQGHLVHGAAAVGGAVHRRIVQHNQVPVGGSAHIHFQDICTGRHTAPKRRQGVFGPQPASTAVGDHLKTGRSEVRMRWSRTRPQPHAAEHDYRENEGGKKYLEDPFSHRQSRRDFKY